MEEVDYLEGDQEGDGLHTVVTSVHVISHEEIVCVGALPADPEQLHQVMKLAVNIATDCHRTLHLGTIHGRESRAGLQRPIAHLLYVTLFGENFLGFFTEGLDLVLRELFTLHQLLYPTVQILQIVLFLLIHFVALSSDCSCY